MKKSFNLLNSKFEHHRTRASCLFPRIAFAFAAMASTVAATASAPTLLSSRSPSLSGFHLCFSPSSPQPLSPSLSLSLFSLLCSHSQCKSQQQKKAPCRVQGAELPRWGEERGGGHFLIVSRLDALGAWCGVFLG